MKVEPEKTKENVKDQFTLLLAEAGTSLDHPELLQTWQAAKTFAQTQHDHTHGFLLFECGVYDWGEGEHFEVRFVRHFYLEVEEGWDETQVEADFSFVPNPELSRFCLSIMEDAPAIPEPTAWIEQVEANEDFWQSVQKYPVVRSRINIG